MHYVRQINEGKKHFLSFDELSISAYQNMYYNFLGHNLPAIKKDG